MIRRFRDYRLLSVYLCCVGFGLTLLYLSSHKVFGQIPPVYPAGLTVQFGASEYYVAQDGGRATITVTLAVPPTEVVTVAYSTSNGTATTGYEPMSGTLMFGPEQTSASFNVSVYNTGITDDYTVNLTLSSAVGAILGSPSTATLTITPPTNTVQFANYEYYVTEDAGTATITVTLAEAPTEYVTVAYSTSDGTATAPTNYEAASGTLMFGPEQTSVTFPVSINNVAFTQDLTINLTLSNPVGATPGSPSSAVLTILPPTNNPFVQFSDVEYYVAQDGGVATITVTLSEASSQSVSVAYSTSDGTATAPTDYTAASGTLTFSPGQTSATFQVAVNNAGFSQDLDVDLTLSNASGGTLDDEQSTAVLTIVPSTFNPTVQFSDGEYYVSQDDDSATITVTLSDASSQSVSVAYSTSNGTATAPQYYQPASGTLTFSPYQTSATFAVTINNTGFSQDYTVNLTLSNPAPTGVTVGSQSMAVLTIIPANNTCPAP